MEQYVIVEADKENYNAGFKAVEDIKKILFNADYKPVRIKIRRSSIFLLKYLFYVACIGCDLKQFRKMQNGSRVMMQIPVKFPRYILRFYLYYLRHIKSCKVTAFIHDIEHLRYEKAKKLKKEELMIYAQTDRIIIHNRQMKTYLCEQGMDEENIGILPVFDYLSNGCTLHSELRIKGKNIVIAGNLSPEKAGYVYEMKKQLKDLHFILYGPNYIEQEEKTEQKNVEYKGAIPSEELLQKLISSEQQFGLIWDGESLMKCAGFYGRYLKYNNPHKLSLYLAAGLPVIVWKQAAIWDFVKENHVGIAVDSLYEIEKLINHMTDDEYQTMALHACEIGKRLQNGYYTSQLICKFNPE